MMSSHVFASILGVDDGRSYSSLILTLLVFVLRPAGQEADENQPLLLLRRLRGQAGPALSVDELLHRCGWGGVFRKNLHSVLFIHWVLRLQVALCFPDSTQGLSYVQLAGQ